MNGAEKMISYITVDEYLEGESCSETRHEYIDGVVYAMSGGTQNHNRIGLNVSSALDDALHAGPCKTFISDMKVRIRTLESDVFYYPDVMVSCAPDDTHPLYLEQPSVIVEVLSDSTERNDKNEKFLAYKNIESLQEYVLISQKEKSVILVRRSNNWQPELLIGDDFELRLASIGQSLTSQRIYRNVDFSTRSTCR